MIKRRVLTGDCSARHSCPVRETAGLEPWPKRLYSLLGPYRRVATVLVDVVIWSSAMIVATVLRYEFNLSAVDWKELAEILPIVAVIHIALGTYEGLYVGRWSFGSFEESLLVASSSPASW